MSGETLPLVMVLNGACWPGNDASGPNRSLRALASALGHCFRFHLVARDRPFGAEAGCRAPLRDPDFGGCSYFPVGRLGATRLVASIEAAKPRLLWLNGFFDREFTLPVLLARRLGSLRGVPVLLSPRGEFGGGALGLKRGRKQVFRHLARMGGLLRDVTLHATGPGEEADIRAGLRMRLKSETAPNMAALPSFRPTAARVPGDPLAVVFLGRVARVKNLDFALRVLASVGRPVRFHIVGPVQDAGYWQECRALIQTLPPHVEAVMHGEMSRAEALALLGGADLLFLPSRSENFGHSIFEALGSGVPVLVSDGTPWRGLAARQAGFDLPLARPEAFAAAVDRFAALPDPAAWRRGARAVAESHVSQADAVRINAAMLARLCGTET